MNFLGLQVQPPPSRCLRKAFSFARHICVQRKQAGAADEEGALLFYSSSDSIYIGSSPFQLQPQKIAVVHANWCSGDRYCHSWRVYLPCRSRHLRLLKTEWHPQQFQPSRSTIISIRSDGLTDAVMDSWYCLKYQSLGDSPDPQYDGRWPRFILFNRSILTRTFYLYSSSLGLSCVVPSISSPFVPFSSFSLLFLDSFL